MTQEDAFLADIIANPADDAVRLIYADWLDGHGREEQGEFIRVQVELASLPQPYPRYRVRRIERTPRQSIDFKSYNLVCDGWYLIAEIDAKDAVKYPPPNPGDGVDFYGELDGGATVEYLDNCVQDAEIQFNRDILLINARQGTKPDTNRAKRESLRRRERELLNSSPEGQEVPNYVHWIGGDNPSHLLHDALKPIYRRGFVAECICTCDDWLAHGPALVRRQPVERVVMTDKTPGRMWGHDGGNESNYRRWWDALHSDTNRQMDADVLPGCLFRYIVFPFKSGYHFPTESSALDALSEAALLWAKQTEPATSSA